MKLSLAVLIGASVCGLAQLAGNPPSKGEWTVRGHVPPEKFVIQSHRGAGTLAPENTVEAFELAWKLGTVPEADLRTTRDGVIVAFHDANFKRVVKGASVELQKKGVADVSFAELSQLDVGAWKGEEFVGRHVSKIADVFGLMRGKPQRWLYLDIKNVDLQQLAHEVSQQAVTSQVILASTDYEIIRRWKELVPESQTLNWMGGSEATLEKRLAALRQNKFAGVTQLQLHIYLNTNSPASEPFTLSRRFIRATGEELRQHDILFQALPWGVAEEKIYHQLLDLGVASFATDHPKVTLEAVRKYYLRN
jgi:glycerophosphoryl diester phosphodiesterase